MLCSCERRLGMPTKIPHFFLQQNTWNYTLPSWLSFYFCSHYSSGKADFRVGISSQTLPDLQHHFATSCDMARYGGLVSAFCGPRSTPLQVKAHSQPAPGGIRSHSRMTAILRRCMRRKLCWSSMARLDSVWAKWLGWLGSVSSLAFTGFYSGYDSFLKRWIPESWVSILKFSDLGCFGTPILGNVHIFYIST